MKEEGYEVEHDGKCITIFSAPNYCDSMGNKGALIRLTAPALKPEFVKFDAVVRWVGLVEMVHSSTLLSLRSRTPT